MHYLRESILNFVSFHHGTLINIRFFWNVVTFQELRRTLGSMTQCL